MSKDRHDLPAWTFRDTREGMELAYGILWECWIDKDTEDGVAASMAREILRAVLSQKECGEGIALARSMRAAQLLVEAVKELGWWLNRITHSGKGNPKIAEALERGREALRKISYDAEST